ncbi:hypothetical protein FIU94_10110 [Sulfitobacter sp. THAF37]|uniref:response regulator receiver domain n=1 Tax=Sulfitobacter sp. THAF37 TaxID=2587855 RepID=UPI0012689E2F|nr:response regulator receiver domain [Sulfitobacter sp. THAF37]QFT59179.1 hypothetical protein FIU94_10110 [Sulfitobacter sp. THAF37]
MTKFDFLDIPKEFLGAAVFIDDALIWPKNKVDTADAGEGLVAPDSDGFDVGLEETEQPAAEAKIPEVNAEAVVDGFSELGLICSTYQWRAEHKQPPKSIDKADLIIIDWKLDETERTALDILAQRLKEDLDGRKRLRYVAIYTDRGTDSVLDAIVEEFGGIDGITASKIEDSVDVKVIAGPSVWRIKHFKKNDVKEEALAEAVVKDFAEFQDGILPRTVMATVAEVRNRTYEHLFRFNRGLDKAISTHLLDKRSSTLEFPTSRESFAEYTTTLVLDDLAAALHSSKLVASVTDKEDLTRCLTLTSPKSIKISDKNDNSAYSFSGEDLETVFFGQDYEVFKELVKSKLSMNNSDTRGFQEGKKPLMLLDIDPNSFTQISILDQINSYPKNIDGHFLLRSGTILKRKVQGQDQDVAGEGNQAAEGGEYFLCLQPVCDAVRLVERTAFPLLKLKLVEQTKKFRFPIMEGTEFKHLTSTFKLSDIVMADFEPNGDTHDVRSVRVGSCEEFTAFDGSKFIWLAELKEHYAAEAQSALAAQGGRIGNNKFEWLRRKASS